MIESRVDKKRVALILPAYNEELTIAQTIADFYAQLPDADFVVVDNRSSDRTYQVASDAMAKLGCRGQLLKEGRPGKGNALRRAFREVDADIYVMSDADSTYPASDISKLLAPILDGTAEMAVGNRHSNSVYRDQNDRLFHDVGNRMVRSLINLLFGSSLSDIMSGYRAMTFRFVKNFPVLSEGFEVETEMTLHAVDKRFAIVEVPIGYRARPAGSHSKLRTFRDGSSVIRTILWIFKDYRPLFFFTILSATSFFLALAAGIPVILEFLHTGLVPRMPTAILSSGLMILAVVFLGIGLTLDTVGKLSRAAYERELTIGFPGPFRPRRGGD